jgi:hypothetical protein
MEEKVFFYKYYILDKNNGNAHGVLDEMFGKITYHELGIEKFFDNFSGKDVETIVKRPGSPTREADASKLASHFENVELTQEYWTAFEHMTGKKRPAINTNNPG